MIPSLINRWRLLQMFWRRFLTSDNNAQFTSQLTYTHVISQNKMQKLDNVVTYSIRRRLICMPRKIKFQFIQYFSLLPSKCTFVRIHKIHEET